MEKSNTATAFSVKSKEGEGRPRAKGRRQRIIKKAEVTVHEWTFSTANKEGV